MRINELFDTKPATINDVSKGKKQGGSYFYSFLLGGKLYKIEFATVKDNAYEVDFSINGKYTVTNTGQQMPVLKTVAAAIIKFLKKYQPDLLLFSAANVSNVEKNNARAIVYEKMLEKFLPDGYTFSTSETEKFTNFKVKKESAN